MATFSKKGFDAAAYLARRPSYPASVVDRILHYAQPASFASPRIAIDVGCGPGQLTNLLAETGQFDQVIGIDPSQNMVQAAKAAAKQPVAEWRVGSAEDLSGIEDGSVTLVTSAQAAHWFDHAKTNKELARILRPGGAIAHLGYGEFLMPAYPKVTPVIYEYFRKRLHGYWEGGRIHAEAEFDTVPHPEPSAGFDAASFQRIKFNLFEGDAYKPQDVVPDIKLTERLPPVLIREWTAEELHAYLSTASGVHNYRDKHPEQDLATEFVDAIKQVVGGDWAQGKPGATETVTWPLALILSRKSK